MPNSSISKTGESNGNSSEVIDYILEQYSEDLSTVQAEELYEHLIELVSSPLNINNASVKDMQELCFLSSKQIDAIREYIDYSGGMKSMAELQLVYGIGVTERMLLSQFMYVGAETDESKTSQDYLKIIRNGQVKMIANTSVPFYTRKGFLNGKYLGSKYPYSGRLQFKSGNTLKVGLTIDKDAGEKGVDYSCVYLSFRNDRIIRNLSIGGMNVRFGQGLILNNGFSLGKSMSLVNTVTETANITPHSGTSQYNYFNGLAGTIALGDFCVSALVSSTAVDATLQGKNFSNLRKDGYHRTDNEISHHGNTREYLYAAHLEFNSNGTGIAASVCYDLFNRYRVHSDAEYQQYYPTGGELLSVSADWHVNRSNWLTSGEIAMSNGGLAILANTTYNKWEKTVLRSVFRSYSKRYYSYHSRAFAESNINNEVGLYVGMKNSFTHITIDSYLDIFHFPWSTYSSQGSSNGFELQTGVVYNSNKNNTTQLRFRYKEKNNIHSSRFRLRWNRSVKDNIKITCGADAVYINDEGKCNIGAALNGNFRYNFLNKNIVFDGIATLFSAEEYSARLYIYERGLPYTYNYQTLYGRGYRLAGVLSWNISKDFRIGIKMGSIRYVDRQTISSSDQKIESSHKEDLDIIISISF